MIPSRRIEPWIEALNQIVRNEIESYYLNNALELVNTHGNHRLDNARFGKLTLNVERPGYYGWMGLEVIYIALHKWYLRPGAPFQLTSQQIHPIAPDLFVRLVLIPEVALRLIADDMRLPPSHSKVKETLESSQDYGSALFSTD